MKMLSNNVAYENYYHFIGATKYRKELFDKESMRDRLKEVMDEIIAQKEKIEMVECTVAYNHIHVLVKSEMDPSKVCKILFGVVSRMMRKEFPILVQKIPKGLWGGIGCRPIEDLSHLNHCISYIKRHQPDNTKMEYNIDI